MAGAPSVYIDSCCFIDLVKQAKGVSITPDRVDDAWFCENLIRAAQDRKVKIFTSAFTQVECVGIKEKDGPNVPVIADDEVKRLFESILASGRSGITPVQPTYFITKAARDLFWSDGVLCKPADRLHLATAISVGCTEFLTADGRINKTQRSKLAKQFALNVVRPQDTRCLPDEYRQLRIDGMANDGPDKAT